MTGVNDWHSPTRLLLVGLLVVSAAALLILAVGVLGFTHGVDATEPSDSATEIDGCTIIDEPGEYVLIDDIEADVHDCIEVEDTADVTIDGGGHTISDAPGDGISVLNVTNLTIEDVTFENVSGSEIFLEESSDLTVTDNTLRETHGFGIRLWNSSDGYVADNDITGPFGGVNTWQSTDVTIENNVISDIVYGIQARDNSSNIYILDNHITEGELCPVDVKHSTDVLFANNYFADGQGINVEHAVNVTFRDNKIVGSESLGVDVLFESSDITVIDNVIAENTEAGVMIRSDAHEVTVENNTITDNGEYGVQVHHDTHDVTVVDNEIHENTEHGISIWHAVDTTLEANSLERNDGGGVLVQHASAITLVDNRIQDNGASGVTLSNATDISMIGDLVGDNEGWAVRLIDGTTSASVDELELVDSSPHPTTVSFEGEEVLVGGVDTDDVTEHPVMNSLDRYVALDADGPDAFIELEVHYDQADLETIDEATLGLHVFDDEWSPLDSTVQEAEQVVVAELTSMQLVGLFGEEVADTPTPDPTPTPTPDSTPTPTPACTPTPGADAPIPGPGLIGTLFALIGGGYLILHRHRGRAD